MDNNKFDLLKSHIEAFTRKDGSVVAAHDDSRQAAMPKPPPISTHADALRRSSKPGDLDHEDNQIAAGYMKSGDHKALASHIQNIDTGARDHILDHVHPDHREGLGFKQLNMDRSKKQYSAKFPAKAAKPAKADSKPAEFGVHHSDLKEGDHLYDKHGQKVDEVEGFSRGVNSPKVHTRAGYSHGTRSDGFLPGLSNKKPGADGGAELGPHKVGDSVSYKGDRGTRTGKVKGSRDGKVVVEHNAGYTELKHHSDLSPAK